MTGKYGDCEDYALAKRSALLQAGWPKDKLGLCVCYTQSGEGHCVLWVDTDKGSFILDNNYDFPMKPSELPSDGSQCYAMVFGGNYMALLNGLHNS